MIQFLNLNLKLNENKTLYLEVLSFKINSVNYCKGVKVISLKL